MATGFLGEAWHWLAVGGVLALVALVLLWRARAADWRNWIIEAATPLPIRLVNARDDVWVRAPTECDTPLAVPHFGIPALYYTYKLEERVKRTRRDKDGRTHTTYSWKTREQSEEAAVFALVDGDDRLWVSAGQARFDDLPSDQDRQGRWRHSCRYLPYPAVVSVVGSVSDDKALLEPYQEIPLIVTPMERDAYVAKIETGESVMRGIGSFLLFAGPFFLAYGLLNLGRMPVVWQWPLGIAAIGIGFLVLMALWGVYTYNTLVTYRIRTNTAFRQVDVDLKNRYDLIPRLVAVVEGYMAHERELLETIARTRAEAVAAGRERLVDLETEAAREMDELAVVVERYPDLKANEQFQFLFKQLTALEEKIAHGRHFYNDAVTEYNTGLESFPQVFVARCFGFQPHRPFHVADTHA